MSVQLWHAKCIPWTKQEASEWTKMKTKKNYTWNERDSVKERGRDWAKSNTHRNKRMVHYIAQLYVCWSPAQRIIRCTLNHSILTCACGRTETFNLMMTRQLISQFYFIIHSLSVILTAKQRRHLKTTKTQLVDLKMFRADRRSNSHLFKLNIINCMRLPYGHQYGWQLSISQPIIVMATDG